jgi:hypothetical protein
MRISTARKIATITALLAVGCLTVSTAQAACQGSNGRGWGRGAGAGQFEMTTADKVCRISFTNVINERDNTSIPATNVSLTRAPSAGKVSVTKSGLVYTPNKGFKGSDTFCTSNTTAKAPGVTLSGCITVTVR